MNFTWFASAYDTDDVAYRLLDAACRWPACSSSPPAIPRAFETATSRVVDARLRGHARRDGHASGCAAARGDPEHAPHALRVTPSGSPSCRSAGSPRLAAPDAGRLSGVLRAGRRRAAGAGLGRARSARRRGTRDHIAERYGLFTIIVLGESVLAAGRRPGRARRTPRARRPRSRRRRRPPHRVRDVVALLRPARRACGRSGPGAN